MFVALVGTDTQYIIDMLEEMFRQGPLLEPKELLTSEVKAKFESACKTEEEAAKMEGEMDPSSTVTTVKAKSLPIAADFGIDLELYPESYPVPGISLKIGKEVNKFYYRCKICKAHSSQNWPNMCTYTWKCLNLKIGCPLCDATYDSSDYLQNHIIKVQGGSLEPTSQKEAETAVSKLASTSMHTKLSKLSLCSLQAFC